MTRQAFGRGEFLCVLQLCLYYYYLICIYCYYTTTCRYVLGLRNPVAAGCGSPADSSVVDKLDEHALLMMQVKVVLAAVSAKKSMSV